MKVKHTHGAISFRGELFTWATLERAPGDDVILMRRGDWPEREWLEIKLPEQLPPKRKHQKAR